MILSKEDKTKIREMFEDGDLLVDIAGVFGVTRQTIQYHLSEKRKTKVMVVIREGTIMEISSNRDVELILIQDGGRTNHPSKKNKDFDSLVSVKERLEYLRGELRNECMSYEELAELQSLSEHIDSNDVELLEPAGVPENR
jgi:DNA-binding transcriptional ArsR family regulator